LIIRTVFGKKWKPWRSSYIISITIDKSERRAVQSAKWLDKRRMNRFTRMFRPGADSVLSSHKRKPAMGSNQTSSQLLPGKRPVFPGVVEPQSKLRIRRCIPPCPDTSSWRREKITFQEIIPSFSRKSIQIIFGVRVSSWLCTTLNPIVFYHPL
jgi:hypothetical protein